MASYTSGKASSTVKSNAGAETFTFDISSAITAANIPAYSKITKATITVWGNIDTATSRGKMTASFGSTSICSDVWAGGSAGEVSRSVDLSVSTFFNSENSNAGKLKDSSTRLTIVLDGPVMVAKFNHTASWQLYIAWTPACTLTLSASPTEGGTVTGAGVYLWDETAKLTAIANEGYRFLYWYDKENNVTNRDSSFELSVFRDFSFVAYFEQIPRYTITTVSSPVEGGTTIGSGMYYENDVFTITAVPNEGYHFVKWQWEELSAIISSFDISRQFEAIGDCVYTAYFEADKINYIYAGTSLSSTVSADTTEANEIYADETKVYG